MWVAIRNCFMKWITQVLQSDVEKQRSVVSVAQREGTVLAICFLEMRTFLEYFYGSEFFFKTVTKFLVQKHMLKSFLLLQKFKYVFCDDSTLKFCTIEDIFVVLFLLRIFLFFSRSHYKPTKVCLYIYCILILYFPGRLCEARAFNKLRIYHTRPNQFNWSPENAHLGQRILGTQITTLGFFLGLITKIYINILCSVKFLN